MNTGKNFIPRNRLRNLNHLFFVLILLSAMLAFWGWQEYNDIADTGRSIQHAAYKTLQTYIFEIDLEEDPLPPQLMLALFMAPLSLAGSIITHAMHKTGNSLQLWVIQRFYKGHIIILGNTPESRALVSDNSTAQKIVYLVQDDTEIPFELNTRRNLRLVYGVSHSPQLLAKLRMDRALSILVFPPSIAAIEDIAKASISAYPARRQAMTQGQPIHIAFAIQSAAVHEVFSQFSHLISHSYAANSSMQFTTFSLEEILARRLIEDIAPHKTLTPRDLVPAAGHLLIHGSSRFLERCILEAAQLYHYAPQQKLRVSIVSDSTAKTADFLVRNPAISEVVDLRTYSTEEFQNWQRSSRDMPDMPPPSTVLVETPQGWDIPRAARSWRRLLLHAFRDQKMCIPVTCILPLEESLTEIYSVMERALAPVNINILPLSELLNLGQLIQQNQAVDSIAREIHESYRQRFGMPPWEELSDWQKTFNRRSASHLQIKLWYLNRTLSTEPSLSAAEMPDITAEQKHFLAQLEHKRWQSEKLLDDFIPGQFPDTPEHKRLYKNILRIHADIVPFAKLTRQDIRKDEQTFAELHLLLQHLLKTHRLVYAYTS